MANSYRGVLDPDMTDVEVPTEVLVTVWPDRYVTVSTRARGETVWSPATVCREVRDG